MRHEDKYEWLEDHLIRRLQESGIGYNTAQTIAHELQHDILVGFGLIDSRNAQQERVELEIADGLNAGMCDA